MSCFFFCIANLLTARRGPSVPPSAWQIMQMRWFPSKVVGDARGVDQRPSGKAENDELNERVLVCEMRTRENFRKKKKTESWLCVRDSASFGLRRMVRHRYPTVWLRTAWRLMRSCRRSVLELSSKRLQPGRNCAFLGLSEDLGPSRGSRNGIRDGVGGLRGKGRVARGCDDALGAVSQPGLEDGMPRDVGWIDGLRANRARWMSGGGYAGNGLHRPVQPIDGFVRWSFRFGVHIHFDRLENDRRVMIRNGDRGGRSIVACHCRRGRCSGLLRLRFDKGVPTGASNPSMLMLPQRMQTSKAFAATNLSTSDGSKAGVSLFAGMEFLMPSEIIGTAECLAAAGAEEPVVGVGCSDVFVEGGGALEYLAARWAGIGRLC